MIWIKSCTRCGGDLFGGADKQEPFAVGCLQCGCYLLEAEVHALDPNWSVAVDRERVSESGITGPGGMGQERVPALTD